jgi:TPP-dependent pyruvate/acetoin dehydrogenase alpha subunit
MFDPELYRQRSEVDDWKHKDPIPAFIEVLRSRDLLSDEDLEQIEDEAAAEVVQAVEFAEQGTLEPVEQLTRWVMSEPTVGGGS